MENVNLFEIASRGKYRFDFKGQITVDDLWDLKLTDLDTIFKALNAQLKQTKEESLLETKTQENTKLENMVQIIKYVVEVKKQEDAAKLQAKENREKKQRVMELIAKKQDESLENMPLEELQKIADELN